jgi:hypothetical protein
MRTTTRLGLLLLAAVLLALMVWALSSSPNQAVGKPAPPTRGTDADGAALALSDYRGKVVMLDFWGDW